MRALLQYLMSSRCAGRVRSARLQPEHKVWRGARHGHRSVYNDMFTGVFGAGLPAMEYCVSIADFAGSGQPLYAYVCDADYGRKESES